MSRPLLDRIDVHVEVPPVPYRELASEGAGEPSSAIRGRVAAARARQRARLGRGRARVNARMSGRTIADLAGAEAIELAHLAEALQYRAPAP